MAKDEAPSAWHVLDFSYDDENNCTLTIFTHGMRFHIVARAENLKPDTEIGAEYSKLLQDIHRSSGESEGHKSANDSGVDVDDDKQKEATADLEQTNEQNLDALQQWLVAPLSDAIEELASQDQSSKQQTIQEWYQCPTRFCELYVASEGNDEMEAIELESTPSLDRHISNMLPQMTLPKWVTNKLDVPTYSAGDFDVIDANDQPTGTPYHPCRVRHRESNDTHFLKVIDNSQTRTTKRELDVLGRITNLRLQEKINVPTLTGLVAFDDAEATPSGKQKIMGFLQTEIPEPTSLHHMFDSTVPQEKRDRWAKEANSIKKILHENDIIWGDAKADNFMVDKHDKLWIIDFGGSYTEGWVDPDRMETKEGDDEGTTKIINGLKDPVKNVQDAEEDSGHENGEAGPKQGKRQLQEVEDEVVRPAKRQRQNDNAAKA